MLKIEVWKCKSTWLALPVNEREAFFNHFVSVARRNLKVEARAEGGPYLIYPSAGCLLVWTWEPKAEGEIAQARQELDAFFELLADIASSPTLTAKSLANKLRT